MPAGLPPAAFAPAPGTIWYRSDRRRVGFSPSSGAPCNRVAHFGFGYMLLTNGGASALAAANHAGGAIAHHLLMPLDCILQVPCAATRETWRLQAAYTCRPAHLALRGSHASLSRGDAAGASRPYTCRRGCACWVPRSASISEMSTIFSFLPELLSAGDGSFFVGMVRYSGGRRTNLGQFEVGLNSVGDRSFVGNSAILPPGASLGNRCLLGVLSTPPDPTNPVPDGTDRLGSPGFRLPNRQKVGGFGDAVTYVPTNKLYFQRAIIHTCRILIPAYTATILGAGGIVALIMLHQVYGIWGMLGLLPALALFMAATATFGAPWCYYSSQRRLQSGVLLQQYQQ